MKTDKLAAIFFDFDETLVATSRASEHAYDEILSFLRSTPETQAIAQEVVTKFKSELASIPDEKYKNNSADEIRINLWKNAINFGLLKSKIQSPDNFSVNLAPTLYNVWKNGRLSNLRFIEEKNEHWLKKLREKFKLVLITNGDSDVQREKLKATDASKFFDHVIISGDEEYAKPHSSIFLKACNMCGITSNECIMIGDNLKTDIKGANMAGITSVLFVQDEKELQQPKIKRLMMEYPPKYIIHSLDSLIKQLDITC